MRRPVAILSGLAVVACGTAELPDWLQTEARSPDGRMVARLWCEDGCDVPEKRLLTLSSFKDADQLELKRDKTDGSRTGVLPRPDIVATAYIMQLSPTALLEAQLSWRIRGVVEVTAACWSDGNYKALPALVIHKGVTIRFRETADPLLCEAARTKALH